MILHFPENQNSAAGNLDLPHIRLLSELIITDFLKSEKAPVAGLAPSKIPNILSGIKVPRVQGPLFLTLAGTDEPVVGVEVVAEPIEVQAPTLAMPVEVRHVAVAIRVHPDLREDQTEFPLVGRNLVLVSEHGFGMAKASESALLFGTLYHFLAAHAGLPMSEKFRQDRLELAFLGKYRLHAGPVGHVAVDLGDEQPRGLQHERDNPSGEILAPSDTTPEVFGSRTSLPQLQFGLVRLTKRHRIHSRSPFALPLILFWRNAKIKTHGCSFQDMFIKTP